MPVDAFDVSQQSSWSIRDKAGLTQALRPYLHRSPNLNCSSHSALVSVRLGVKEGTKDEPRDRYAVGSITATGS